MYFQIRGNKSGRCHNLVPGGVPWGNFCNNCLRWGSIFILFPYFVYFVHFTITVNCNFKSCLLIHCLASQLILNFFPFFDGFAFAFGNFVHYCVFLLKAPLSHQDKKERCLQWVILYLGNLDLSSLLPEDPNVPLFYGFRGWYNLLA